jgi:hypothetical protein
LQIEIAHIIQKDTTLPEYYGEGGSYFASAFVERRSADAKD